MSKKADLLDLSDLLPSDWVPPVQKLRIETGVEVLYHWTNFICLCGSSHDAPTYGTSPMVKIETKKRRGNGYVHDSYIYYPMPCADAFRKLPRRLEITTIKILSCPDCLDRFGCSTEQLELFGEQPEVMLPDFIPNESDVILFETALDVLEGIEIAPQIADTISFFADKETN